VNLLSLGTAQRRLFAIHEPAAPTPQTRAAVLCQPLGPEYTYAHRAMRQLALRLTMAGYHTLRFDYYGTGDSAGPDTEVVTADCERDVESALEALADIAGVSRLTMIGLRMGANIAADVAVRRRGDIEKLVLWDPIVCDGLSALAGALPHPTGVFITDGSEALKGLMRGTTGSGASGVFVESVPTQCPWVESASISGALPVAVIQRILEWLQ